ncbi:MULTISPECIES: ComEC/Rec2 family competence protein [Thermus]|jgi:competence protein ComEC|uniref:ComEC/Rec2 family competence protein n=1 Tax=Thermus sp. TaxID=275 RepID=UPI0030B6704D
MRSVGIGLGLGGLLGALALLHPLWALGLLGLPLLRLPFLLGFLLVLGRGVLLPLPEPPYGARVEGVFRVAGGFTVWEGHRLWVAHYPPLEDGLYQLRGYIAPPEGRTNPGGLDQRAWLLSQGSRGVLKAEGAERVGGMGGLGEVFRKRLAQGLSPEAKEVLEGLVLGEKRGLEELYPLFQKAGLAHLLALSGLHVGLLLGAFLLLYPLGRARFLLALLALGFYLLLAGPSPSLVRASLMGGLSLLGLLLGLGRAGVLQGLGVALFLQLLLRPEAVLGLGFQLSHLAVLGMALVLPALRPPPGPWGWVLGGLAATLAAQSLLLPLLLHHFHLLPLLSPLTNLLALPLAALLVPLGFLKLFLGAPLAPLAEPLAQGLLALAEGGSRGPLLRMGEIAPLGFAFYYLALLPPLLALHGRLPWGKALLLASFPTLLGLLQAWPKPLDLWALDVGQGDAFLARLGRAEVLVDGGRPEMGERVVRALRALGVEALEVLVATHPDADHAGGLLKVVEEVPVGLAILSPAFGEEDPLAKALKEKGIPTLRPGAGTRLRVGRGTVEVLWPETLSGEENRDGLALLLGFGKGRALLLADLPQEAEEALEAPPVEVLKVSHHGSRTGTSPRLLEQAQPKVALIGVGKNPHGHPHPEVLERLKSHGVRVYRTDRDGAVRVLFGYAW